MGHKRTIGTMTQPAVNSPPVGPVMPQGAIKVISALDDNRKHYFSKTLPSSIDGCWISFDVAFTDDYLTNQESTAGGYDSFLLQKGHPTLGDMAGGFGTVNNQDPSTDPLSWYIGETNDVDHTIFTPEPLTWYHIDYHTNHPVYNEEPYDLDIYVDDIPLSVTPNLAASPTTTDQVSWGLTNYNGYGTYGFTVPMSIYLKQMMVGTSKGAHDIFDGRYLSTTNWPFDGSLPSRTDWILYDAPPF